MAYKNPIKDFNLRSSPELSTGYFGKFWNGKVEQNMYNVCIMAILVLQTQLLLMANEPF